MKETPARCILHFPTVQISLAMYSVHCIASTQGYVISGVLYAINSKLFSYANILVTYKPSKWT